MDDLKHDITEMAEVFNASDPKTVIGYLDAGNGDAAAELLCTEALVHESCMNQSTADEFYSLADRITEEIIRAQVAR